MHKIVKLVSGLMFLTLLSKGLGFLREILMSYYYGTSTLTDTYSMANSSANILFGWLLAVSYLHTPLYQEVRSKQGEKKGEEFSNQLLYFILTAGIFMVGISYLFGETFLHLIAKGFSKPLIEQTNTFFFWAVIAFVLNTINQTLISEYNCKGKYMIANSTNLFLSAVQISMVFLSGLWNNINLLKLSVTCGAIVQFVFLFLYSLSNQRSFVPGKWMKNEFKKLGFLFMPVFLSSIMDELNAFVDKMFASQLRQGSIASLNYAHLVKQLMFHVFVTSIVTYLYPKMSLEAAKKDPDGLNRTIVTGIRYMMLLFMYLTVVSVFYSREMITIIFGRGEFNASAIQSTTEAFLMYSLALLPLAVREILLKGFQAKQNTKINLWVGIGSSIVNISINMVLVSPLKQAGLALSTSLTAYITLPFLIFAMEKQVGKIISKKIVILAIKSIASALGSVLLSRIIYQIMEDNFGVPIVTFFLSLGISFLFYVISLYLWNVRIEKEE